MREQLLSLLGVDVSVSKGNGYRYISDDGTVYHDALSQYGANPFGLSDKELSDALRSHLLSNEPSFVQPFEAVTVSILKKRLSQMSGIPGSDVILTTSGTESVETALKMARVKTGRTRVIAFDQGFHGKTPGSLQITGNPIYRNYFLETNSRAVFLNSNEPESWLSALTRYHKEQPCAALVFEVVQGEGGMHALDIAHLKELASKATDLGICVIVDEIQTGFYRAGERFLFQKFDLNPDVVLVAKALGGGLVPIGACISRPGFMPVDFTLYHSSTFANNNLTASVALAFLDKLESEVAMTVPLMSTALDIVLKDLLSDYPDVFLEVSGLGLMRGIELIPLRDSESLMSNFLWNSGLMGYIAASWLIREQNLVTMPCFSKPSVLRIQPPLTSDESLLDNIRISFSNLAELVREDRSGLLLLPHKHSPNKKPVAELESEKFEKDVTSSPLIISNTNKSSVTKNLKFQFSVHPLDHDNFRKTCPKSLFENDSNYIEEIESSLYMFREFGKRLSSPCYQIEPFELGGSTISGQIYSIGWYAKELMSISEDDRKLAIASIGKAAVDYDASVLGLGGFTSIISKGGYSFRNLDMSVTSGSCLTAVTAVQSSIDYATIDGINYGVIGANGSIGELCWQLLLHEILNKEKSDNIYLLYNPDSPNGRDKLLASLVKCMEKITKSEYHKNSYIGRFSKEFSRRIRSIQGKASGNQINKVLQRTCLDYFGRPLLSINAANDKTVLFELDHVLVATNQVGYIQGLESLKKGSIVFDIGRPASVDSLHLSLLGIRVFESGLVKHPSDILIARNNLVGLPSGVLLGCLAETMLTTACGGQLIKKGTMKLSLDNALDVKNAAKECGMISTVIEPYPVNRVTQKPIIEQVRNGTKTQQIKLAG